MMRAARPRSAVRWPRRLARPAATSRRSCRAQLAPGIHLLATPPDYRGAGDRQHHDHRAERRRGRRSTAAGTARGRAARSSPSSARSPRKPVKALVYHPLAQRSSAGRIGDPRRLAAGPDHLDRGDPRTAARAGRDATSACAPTSGCETHLPQPGSRARSRRSQRSCAIRSIDEATRGALRAAWIARHRGSAWRDFRGTYLVLPTETFTDELLLDDPERPVRLMLPRPRQYRRRRDRLAAAASGSSSPATSSSRRSRSASSAFPGDWIGVLERLKALDFRSARPRPWRAAGRHRLSRPADRDHRRHPRPDRRRWRGRA